LVGQHERHPACKNVGCWYVGSDDLTGALLCSGKVVTTTSFTLISNKIQNGDNLVPAYIGCPGKWPLNEHGIIGI